MSAENFIPAIWAGELLAAYDRQHIYVQLTNRDYEGEIRQQGDTVLINSVADPTVKDYVKGSDIDPPEEPDGAQQVLEITEAKYLNVMIDDIDARQGKPERMREVLSRGAFRLAQAADQFMAAKYTEIASGNMIGSDASPVVPTADTLYEHIIDLSVILDENDVPADGRFIVLPPWCRGLLQKDDRFASFGTTENRGVIRGTPIKMVDNLAVYISNNVPNTAGTKYKIIAGHPDAWSFADQIPLDGPGALEAYRPERRFGDAMKGLHVYGGSVTRPYALALATFNKS